ncbi:MAG: hypothetical protein ABUL49_01305 [bacterium]
MTQILPIFRRVFVPVLLLLGACLSHAAVKITDLVLSSTFLVRGNTYTGTVSLNGPAPAGGAGVALGYVGEDSMDGIFALDLPASVTVPQGATTASFTFTSHMTEAPVRGQIYAEYNGTVAVPASTNLLSVESIKTESRVVGGANINVTIRLNGTPSGQERFSFCDVYVMYPGGQNPYFATVNTPINTREVSFQVPTYPVAGDGTINVGVSFHGAPGYDEGANATVAVLAHGTLLSLTQSTNSVVGGGNVVLVATLDSAAPAGGTKVPLNNNGFTDLNLPAYVLVREGRTWDAVSFNPKGVDALKHTTYSGGFTGTTPITLNLDIRKASFISLGFSPATQVGGTTASGVAKLDGLAGPSGAVISLVSHHAILSVPANVTIPAQTSSKAFGATTQGVNADSAATATGTYGGVSLNGGITIKKATALNLTGPTTLHSGATGTYTLRLNGKAGNLGTKYDVTYTSGTGPANTTVPAGGIAVAFNVKAPTAAVGTHFTITVKGPTGDTASIVVTIN